MKKKGFEVREKTARYFTEEELVQLIENTLPSLVSKKPELKLKLRSLFDDVATKSDIIAILEEMKKQREDTNRRFEEMREDMNRRFEEVNKRFEAMDRRFEAVDRRFEEMREDMDRRFEEVHLEMKAMREDFKEAIEKTIKALSSKIDTVGSRWGIMAENSIRELLNEVVSRVGFTTIKWKKKDEEGRFFLRPRNAEIDILIKDTKTLAIEVKSSLTKGEVDDFEKCVRFYEEVEGKKVDERVILAVHPYPGTKDYASQLGIRIISEPEEISAI